MAEAGHVRVQYQDLEQQTRAAELGMWVFMASEVLFFSGLFALFLAYRVEYGAVFRVAARHTDLALGTANTYILLTSSLLVVLAIHVVRTGGPPRVLEWLLGGTIALGVVFLGLKLLEYVQHFHEGIYPGPFYALPELPEQGARVFFTLYYLMTGLHAIHVTAGIVMLTWLLSRPAAAGSPPSTTRRSSSAASTGTSSTSSGCSSGRCSTC